MSNNTTFTQFLTEDVAIKNDHIPHLEDLMLYGSAGLNQALVILQDVFNQLQGEKSRTRISVKWDGAPAIVFGPDPMDGQFFVSTKAAFNKTPKIAKTHEEIEEKWSNGIVKDVLHKALDELPALGSPQILQGDVLFCLPSAIPVTITAVNGLPYALFTPNALTYGIPYRDFHEQVFGIAIHTAYSGGTLEQLSSAPLDVNAFLALNFSHRIFVVNAFNDMGRLPMLTNEELQDIELALTSISQDVSRPWYLDTTLDGLDEFLKLFQNKLVREQQALTSTQWVDELALFIMAKRDEAVTKRKTARGKDSAGIKYERALNQVLTHRGDLVRYAEVYERLQYVKNHLIQKLNGAVKIPTFVPAPGGYSQTSPEGFVVTLRDGQMVKFVNRAYFSNLNFGVQTWHQS